MGTSSSVYSPLGEVREVQVRLAGDRVLQYCNRNMMPPGLYDDEHATLYLYCGLSRQLLKKFVVVCFPVTMSIRIEKESDTLDPRRMVFYGND